MIFNMWRVGNKVPVNVYDGDRPVCQCHSEDDAKLIVQAVNVYKAMPSGLSEAEIQKLFAKMTGEKQ